MLAPVTWPHDQWREALAPGQLPCMSEQLKPP